MDNNKFLKLTEQAYNNQSKDTKETITIVNKVWTDQDIQTVINVLNEEQEQCLSFSHS